MDELELLKQDWKKRGNEFPQVSYQEIYNMLLKKSSSIVKWIFIISVAEFIFWIAFDFLVSTKESKANIVELELEEFYLVANIINYSVLVFFVVKFYLNFKKIKTTDSAKELMRNIVRTRRTVKHYVWFNMAFFALAVSITFAAILHHDHLISKLSEENQTLKIIIIFAVFVLMLGFMLLILWLFYRLLYGILTRRLHKNYKELKKLEF